MCAKIFISAVLLVAVTVAAAAGGNRRIDSFAEAKKLLEQNVYYDHRETFYCRAVFDSKKNVTLPSGFVVKKHENRARKVEWEHVVPAENFGRAFAEWREGDDKCVKNGKLFKGRSCAEQVNAEFRYMISDMYNLYPAIGAVNAARSNFRYTMLPGVPSSFGACEFKIQGRAVEPPDYTRGVIARTMLYMQDAYPRYKMSEAQRKLMIAWDSMYPVDHWECERARRIKAIQGNENEFVTGACRKAGL